MEGYIRGRPDVEWWITQLENGEEFRRKFAHEDRWAEWRKMYRGDWDRDIIPVNLFFMMVRSVVPRIYFRNPGISIMPGRPGIEHAMFAKVMERISNKLMRSTGMKQQIKKVVQDAFFLGTGFTKTGFGGFYNPTPEIDTVGGVLGDKQQRVEYRMGVEGYMPWVARAATGTIIVPAGLDCWENARWVAEKISRPLDDLKEDPRFRNTAALNENKDTKPTPFGSILRPQKLVELYEIHDRKTGKVFVIVKGGNYDKPASRVLYYEDDFFAGSGLPYSPLQFNDDDEVFWAVSDSKILEPMQNELNETRTMIHLHRRLSLVRFLARRGKVSEEEAAKLLLERKVPVLWTNDDPNRSIGKMDGAGVPDGLLVSDEMTRRDVRETLGFSRNQAGEVAGDRTTAHEAEIVRQAMEIRVDERRDITADLITDVMGKMHSVIFDLWDGENVVDMVGPGGAQVWVKFQAQDLKKSAYSLIVDPDSSVPETRMLREKKAAEVYSVLKENPLIEPFKLTQYLLHELHGVQFDDMMRQMPMNANMPQAPVTMQEFGQLIAQQAPQIGAPRG